MSRFTAPGPRPSQQGTVAPLDVTVGIDFGTSSAKLAFREFGGRRSVLVPTGRRTLQWPCVIVVRDGRLHFADEPAAAAAAGPAATIRWLKMLLAEEYGAERDGYREQMRAAVNASGCSVPCLAALFLAYLMRRAGDRARSHFGHGGGPEVHLTYNVGAPLETFADADAAGKGGAGAAVSDGFLLVSCWAERLTSAIPAAADDGTGWPVDEARSAFERVRTALPAVPPDRTVFVVPETHAVVTGAVLAHGRLESGNYVAVDIGAGTTDVAVFLYNSLARRDGRWAVTYLADAVRHEASTQADRCVAELIRERMQDAGVTPPPDAAVMELARRAKERGGGREPVMVEAAGTAAPPADGRPAIRLTPDDFRQCVAELTSRLFHHYRKHVIRALGGKTKDGLERPFRLILLGGGSRFAPFRDQFLGVLPDPNHPRMRPEETWVSLRDHLQVLAGGGTDGGGRLEDLPQRDYQLFSLVHGLTTHIVRLPGFWRPGDVDQMEPPPAADRTPYTRMDDD
jgi:hypothetical protein